MPIRCVTACFLVGFAAAASFAAGTVVHVRVEGEINRGTVLVLGGAIARAEELGADLLVISLSTPGGYLDAALRCRDILLGAPVKTVAYVDREALSAGALIALSCERVYFAPGGAMGAATPVYFERGRMEEAPEKVISAVREIFRATAEARGRDPDVAAAMVDPDLEIPGLVERGKLLTLTPETAAGRGYSDGLAESLAEVLAAEGVPDAAVEEFAVGFAARAVAVLTSPFVSGLLIALGIMGLLVELSVPGFGIPGIVGIGALSLFFWSHFAVGLAGWESLGFFIAGLILVLLEIFVFTAVDFGAVGIVGLGLIGFGFYTAMVGPLTEPQQITRAVTAVSAGLAVALVGLVLIITLLPRTRLRFGGVLLRSAIDSRALRTEPRSEWVGRTGVALTDLRPVGKGEFSGRIVDVVSEEGYLPKGTEIVITRAEGIRFVVRKAGG
ncbi:NfeD family protein [Candidatus Bipolaricaulota sp. J31]